MHFLGIAVAQAQGQSGGILGFLPMIAILVIVYFLMLRPQMKRQKEHTKMLSVLGKGDEIVTTGGIHGVIQKVNEKEGTLVLKISEEVKVVVDRGAVARKLTIGTATEAG